MIVFRILGTEKLDLGRHISVTENSVRPRLSLKKLRNLTETWHDERFPKVWNNLVFNI